MWTSDLLGEDEPSGLPDEADPPSRNPVPAPVPSPIDRTSRTA
ncbi:MAG TPA: hypothetical protein VNM40_02975 [Candidatus Paceibacterota bacterium]|nr:hypothetical protein [Candidatus Paceibacterota bacterium]